jgi:ketosteroid isomerase-like protein
MKQLHLILLIVLYWVGIHFVSAQNSVQADERTVAFLKQYRTDYCKAIQAKSPAQLGRYYAQNVRLMPEFQKTVMGKANAVAYHTAFLARFTVQKCSRTEIEILNLGTRVVELGTFITTATLKSTGKAYELQGKYQTFWEQQPPGGLVLLTEAWNYSQPVDIADQLRFAQVPAVYTALEPHVPITTSISFELAALNRLLETTITQHDAVVWSQFYTDDTKLVYSNNPIYEGRKAVDDFLEKHVKQIPIFEKLDIRNDRIDDLGTYVIEYASHIASFRAGTFGGVNTGKNVTIWRREKNGSLKIFRGMAMYD